MSIPIALQETFHLGMTLWYVFYGISGGRVNKKEHCTRWERVISDIRPHHLVFRAGGHDLDQHSCDGFTEEMVFLLLSILSSWKG
jgi:hypothetical protein